MSSLILLHKWRKTMRVLPSVLRTSSCQEHLSWRTGHSLLWIFRYGTQRALKRLAALRHIDFPWEHRRRKVFWPVCTFSLQILVSLLSSSIFPPETLTSFLWELDSFLLIHRRVPDLPDLHRCRLTSNQRFPSRTSVAAIFYFAFLRLLLRCWGPCLSRSCTPLARGLQHPRFILKILLFSFYQLGKTVVLYSLNFYVRLHPLIVLIISSSQIWTLLCEVLAI